MPLRSGTAPPVPFNDLRPQYQSLRDDIDAAIARVLNGGRVILGPEVEAFEQEFAGYCGVAHGVGLASGTDALSIGLKALGVRPGDEVITVANAGVPPVAAVELAGARPVLVDIDPSTHTMAPEAFRAAITTRTRAVVVVQLYGQPADMEPLLAIARQRGVRVLEDCAQAHGAMYRGRRCGSVGDAAAFSFYPTKNLGGYGDGGMLVTADPDVADQARLLRQYGWRTAYYSEIPGLNSRLDELQAAILRVKLRHLDTANDARRRIARRYTEALEDLAPVREAQYAQHVYHLYVVQVAQRDALRSFLSERGVSSAIHYPIASHLQAAYARLGTGLGSLPVSERAAETVLSLPLFPELSEEDAERVIEACRSFLSVA